MTALSFLKEQQQARQDMIFMLRQTFALKKENRLLFRQVFAQKLMRAGFFQFIHAQVSVLSIAVSLTIQSELLIRIIIIPQTRVIL